MLKKKLRPTSCISRVRNCGTSISVLYLSACNKLQQTFQFHLKLQEISLNQTCCNLSFVDLLQLVETSLWITSFEIQLATSSLTTCNRLAMRTHPDIGLLIKSLLQNLFRLVPTCAFLKRRSIYGVIKLIEPPPKKKKFLQFLISF